MESEPAFTSVAVLYAGCILPARGYGRQIYRGDDSKLAVGGRDLYWHFNHSFGFCPKELLNYQPFGLLSDAIRSNMALVGS